MRKIIITAAVTGNIHTPTMSPYLPLTPDEIVGEAVKAYEAGAAIVHYHVRDPETGRPVVRLELFREIATKIKERCPLVLCPTTGGGLGQTPQERTVQVADLKPELASFNMGPVMIAAHPMAKKYTDWKFSWEKEYLESFHDFAFINTYKTLEEFATIMNENGTKPECEVYEIGMLNNVAYFIDQGVLKEPVHIQFVLGLLGQAPATVKNLSFLVETARETIGNFTWSVAAAGRHQLLLAAAALAMDGNVRVGLEDSLMVAKGQLAKSNAEQVERVVEMARALDIEVATPDDARKILELKGLEKVNY
ncbi:3-keto-5-aminohexanoate cleavage protein [Chloroflexota bacterium]